jgi:TM2 domain-containing membrane protein YozV
MAALLSLICPGLGQLIIGRPFQAVFWFLMVVSGYVAEFAVGALFHAFCVASAYRDQSGDMEKRLERAIRSGTQR